MVSYISVNLCILEIWDDYNCYVWFNMYQIMFKLQIKLSVVWKYVVYYFSKITEFGFGLKALYVKFGVVNVHYHNFYTPCNIVHVNTKRPNFKWKDLA